jgi:hypothetical protein
MKLFFNHPKLLRPKTWAAVEGQKPQLIVAQTGPPPSSSSAGQEDVRKRRRRAGGRRQKKE